MNKIYYIEPIEYINGHVVYDGDTTGYAWHYGDPAFTTKTVTDFVEFFNNTKTESPVRKYYSKLLRKNIIKFDLSWCETMYLNKKTFHDYRCIYKVHYPQHYTVQDLMGKLPAEEFIQYMKDNGLTMFPSPKE